MKKINKGKTQKKKIEEKEVIKNYQIIKFLASGGEGSVYLVNKINSPEVKNFSYFMYYKYYWFPVYYIIIRLTGKSLGLFHKTNKNYPEISFDERKGEYFVNRLNKKKLDKFGIEREEGKE